MTERRWSGTSAERLAEGHSWLFGTIRWAKGVIASGAKRSSPTTPDPGSLRSARDDDGQGIAARRNPIPAIVFGVATLLCASRALAAPAFSCGGFAMQGGAELLCSHTDPTAPPQICTYSWTLQGQNGLQVVSGSFLLMPGIANAMVYQGSGFSYEISSPIVLCQGQKTGAP